MKSTLIFLSFILFYSCNTYTAVTAQKSGEIIDAPGTKDELYIKANQWMVRIFKDAKSVIQFQDKAEGKIMGKFLLRSMGSREYSEDVFCLITISVKDNATKIEVEPMGAWKYDSSGLTIFNYSPEMAKDDMNEITSNYKKVILEKSDTWAK